MKRVTTIPATLERLTSQPIGAPAKKRVAAYARVSTDKEEQESSFEAQIDHYTKHIQGNPDWIFAGMYSDEGLSAVSTAKRDGFNRMMQDALDGKIDMIITKSVSRFARNTIDSITAIRKLKEHNCYVIFEKEGIRTDDSKGELMLTIMSSLAQEESRSISENVRWGWQKRLADGKVTMTFGRFLGYEKGTDDEPQIFEKEAKVVRYIYQSFLSGMTPAQIAAQLTVRRVPTAGGKSRWWPGGVRSILQNEKYKGDALLQKCYVSDFLTKKLKKNRGEFPQYYVENSHPGIVEREIWEQVQIDLKRQFGKHKSASGIFAGQIICGECSGVYGRRVWNKGANREVVMWQCNQRYKSRCVTPVLREEDIKKLAVEAINKILTDKEKIIEQFVEAEAVLFDVSELKTEQLSIRQKIDELSIEVREQVINNGWSAQDQSEYRKEYNLLGERYQELRQREDDTNSKIWDKVERRKKAITYIDELAKQERMLTEFDEDVWKSLVDYVKVIGKEDIRFVFRDGTEIRTSLTG
jgi:DNA invertase Pin-like site-specific DNA recombinase